jgi:SPP1 gp7 family putative phage head morphogenesis protein
MAVRREALTLARKSRNEVDEALAQATRALTIAWAKSWDDLEADFSRAFGDLVSNAPGDRGLSRVRVRQDERLQYAMGRVSRSLGDLMTVARNETAGVVKIAVSVGDQAQRDIIAAQLPADHRGLVTESRAGDLAALITRASRRVSILTRNLPNVIDRRMREAIARVAMARLKPDASQALLRQAEASFNTGLTHALMIARTEALDAHRQAAALSQARQAEVLSGWIWLARLDRWTCPACFVMHGSTHALDEMGPDGHQSCRCQRVPKAKSWKELGINLTEPVDLIPDGRTVFQSLPRSQQLSILGPTRLDLLDRGEIEWGDLATQRQNPGWRRSYVPTPVHQLIEG